MQTVPAHAEEPAIVQARALSREALQAYEAKDFATFLARMETAVALRPDYPRLLVNLAAAQAANDQPEAAVATLQRLAALGVSSPVEKSADFAALRNRDDFKAVVAKLAANVLPSGSGEIAFSLPGMRGLIEGIAWREKTGEFFFGDVHHRAVWVRSADGKLRRFSEETDEVRGVFGLIVDETSGTLWAATSAVPGMRGYTPEQDGDGALADFDLVTGKLRRVIPVPRDRKQHVLGDLALAADGTVFLTDSVSSTLWRLTPGGSELQAAMDNAEFVSLQGLALAADATTAVASDYANGLLRVDLAAKTARVIESPPSTTLLGIDGIVRVSEHTLIGIQSGVRPARLLKLTLSAGDETVSAVEVLEAAHLAMAEPGLGCLGPGGDFYFIGLAGWSRFENTDNQPSIVRTVPIFRTKLKPAVPPKDPANR